MATADCSTFIAGSARSGTTLMTSLLDGHQDLLVFPEEYLYVRPQSLLDEKNSPIVNAMFKNKVLRRLQGEKSFLDGMHEEGRSYTGFDFQHFASQVDEYFHIFMKKEGLHQAKSVEAVALIALMCGFARVRQKEQYLRWVIKNPQYEVHWQKLFTDFPDTKLIYMVRDPRDVVLSRTIKKNKKKHLIHGGDVISWKDKPVSLRPSMRFLKQWERSVNSYRAVKKSYPGQVMRVRYEDLVSLPRETMHSVAEFLGLNWHEILITPTFLGNPWKGGSMHGQTFDGINRSNKSKKYTFPPHYLWQIEAWLGNLMVDEPGGYVPSDSLAGINVKALLSWLRGEGLLEFMHNRLRMLSNRQSFSAAQN